MDIAVCIGGADCCRDDLAKTLELIKGRDYQLFACNDMIEHYEGSIDFAVTLHPAKLSNWLSRRELKGYTQPETIWAHGRFSNSPQVTNVTSDWGGSSGLFMVKIAIENGYRKIILNGVTMDPSWNHFVRQVSWGAGRAFRRGWAEHWKEFAPYTRAWNGWAAEKLGAPTEEWLTGPPAYGVAENLCLV